MTLQHGLVQVYTGDGKGKTTAALGLALRAAGHGFRVYIIQFMKGWPEYGELRSVELLPTVRLRQYGRKGFVHPQRPLRRDFELAREALEDARSSMLSGEVDILILDEINNALEIGLIELQDVLALLEQRPGQVEVILTGRRAPPELLERADLATEMRNLKHPFEKGIESRKGIEY